MQAPHLSPMVQIDLFDVLSAYASGSVHNSDAYAKIGEQRSIPASQWQQKKPFGHAAQMHSQLKVKVRWHQQTLKRLGLIEPVAGQRGHWRITSQGRVKNAERMAQLQPQSPGLISLGFSTELGVALWADCRDTFSAITEPVHCVLTSPPYRLAKARHYGGTARDDQEYVDWLCSCLEPVIKRLVPGGTVFLNVSNDIFEPKSPARSLYRERLLLALHERLGLSLMDVWVWHNPSKAPGPVQWASLKRMQVNTGWEPVYYLTNDPHKCIANNQRVLRPHTDKHQRLIDSGGAKSCAVYADGANHRRVGAFSNPTAGAIARNVITLRHNCPSQAAMRKWARDNDVPLHSATMPLQLAEHIVLFGSEEGDLIADPFGGWLTTAVAAERNKRRWIVSEKMRAYLHAAHWRMAFGEGFSTDIAQRNGGSS